MKTILLITLVITGAYQFGMWQNSYNAGLWMLTVPTTIVTMIEIIGEWKK